MRMVSRLGMRRPNESVMHIIWLSTSGRGAGGLTYKQWPARLSSTRHKMASEHLSVARLQGVMSGKDFARSVVCSVHTNQIEEYLAKVDALPDSLANAKVRGFSA